MAKKKITDAAAAAAGAEPRRGPLRDDGVAAGAADGPVALGGPASGVAPGAPHDASRSDDPSRTGARHRDGGGDGDMDGGGVRAARKKGGGKQKGAPKTGGRKKGTPNIVTADTRQAIRQAWQHYVSTGKFSEDLEGLSGYDRLVLMERLVGYTVPKLKSIDLDAKVEQRLTIEDRLRQLAMDDD